MILTAASIFTFVIIKLVKFQSNDCILMSLVLVCTDAIECDFMPIVLRPLSVSGSLGDTLELIIELRLLLEVSDWSKCVDGFVCLVLAVLFIFYWWNAMSVESCFLIVSIMNLCFYLS